MMMMMTSNGGGGDTDGMFNDLGGDELNNLMNVQLSLMDLPPDKLKIVKMLPDEKKIQFLRSLRFVNEKQPPEYYIQALNTYIEVIVNQKATSKRSKFQINETSTELIKNLEVSLRTNRIDWVHKFLDPPLNGLDILIEYLKNSLNIMRENDRFNASFEAQNDGTYHSAGPLHHQHHLNGGAVSNGNTLTFSSGSGGSAGSGSGGIMNGHMNHSLNGNSSHSHCKATFCFVLCFSENRRGDT